MCCNPFTLAHQNWPLISSQFCSWSHWQLEINLSGHWWLLSVRTVLPPERHLLNICQNTAGELILLSQKYLLIIIFGGFPAAPLCENENPFHPFLLVLILGITLGHETYLEGHLTFPSIEYSPVFCYYNEISDSGSYLKKGLTFVYNSWDFSSGSDDPLLWSSGKHNKHSPPSVKWNKPIHHMNQRAKEGRDQGSTTSCKNTPPMTWEPPWYSAF